MLTIEKIDEHHEVRTGTVKDAKAIFDLISVYAKADIMLRRPIDEIYNRIRDFIVFEEDGEIQGVCAHFIVNDTLSEIRSLAVNKKYKGRGIGKALVSACIKEAKELCLKEVFVLTYEPQFFVKLKFKEIEKEVLPHKIWHDCITCSKFPNCDETALLYKLD